MRIAIDGRELGDEPTGVGRYLQRLLQEWARMDAARAHWFSVYSPDGRISLPPDFHGEVSLVPGDRGTSWEQGALAQAIRRDRPDVLFAPGYTAPLLQSVPTALAIHDVSFLAHPEWFGRREGLRRRMLVRLAAARARRILTLSDFSREEIVKRLRISPDRIRVIRLGLGMQVTLGTTPREPLVLYVGTLFNRRHIPELIDAFARIAARNPAVHLVLVGRNRTHPHQDPAALAQAAGVGSRVTLRDWIEDRELADLYRRASAFAFLSEYEGFGLTPLEAMGAGVPPVVLDTPVAREIYGDAAIHVARPEPAAVAAALADALDPASARRRAALEAAPAILARYSWARAATETLAVLEEIGRR